MIWYNLYRIILVNWNRAYSKWHIKCICSGFYIVFTGFAIGPIYVFLSPFSNIISCYQQRQHNLLLSTLLFPLSFNIRSILNTYRGCRMSYFSISTSSCRTRGLAETLAYIIRFGIWHLAINAVLCGRIRCAAEFTKEAKPSSWQYRLLCHHQFTIHVVVIAVLWT